MQEYRGSVAESWWGGFEEYRRSSTKHLMSLLPDNLNGKSILDLGCGPGEEIAEYRHRKAKFIAGVDLSPDMTRMALLKSSADIVVQGDMSSPVLDMGSAKFDWIVSKWAVQAVPDYDRVYQNIHRLLLPHGHLLILLVHPIRQYMEKKKKGKNYFKQEVVESVLFNGAVTVREPSHTFGNVLSSFFLVHFDLLEFVEGFAEGCDVVDGDHYPSYILFKAQKRL